MGKAAEKWIISVRKVGTPAADAAELHLTNSEMDEIVSNVDGSCLRNEAELCWLFREAGLDMPQHQFQAYVNVTADAEEDIKKAIEDGLRTAGLVGAVQYVDAV